MHNRPPIQLTATIETNRRYHHTIYRIYKLQRHLTAESREKKNHKIPTTHQQYHSKGMEGNTTYGNSRRCKSHNPQPLDEELESKLKIPTTKVRDTFKHLNVIAIQYAHSILVHKRRLENRQPITNLQDP